MTARKHHYLSQCYLKGFTPPGGDMLRVIDTQRRKSFQTAPANVAAIRDFNRVEVPGMDPDQVERDYSKFEGQIAPILDRLSVTPSLPPGADFELVLELAALFAARNPRIRAMHADILRQLVHIAAEDIYGSEEAFEAHRASMRADGKLKDGHGNIPFAEMKAAWESGKYKVETHPNQAVRTDLSNFDHLLDLLQTRNWLRLTVPPDSVGFITGDHPVCLEWENPHGPYPPGFASPGTLLLFPVTRSLALLGTFDGPDAETVIDENLLAAVNGTVIGNAAAQVYAPSENFIYRLRGDDAPKPGNALLDDAAIKKLVST